MDSVASFNQILELIEQLTVDEQLDLVEIVRHRMIESKRNEIAHNISQSRAEYQSGDVFRGSVEEVLHELDL